MAEGIWVSPSLDWFVVEDHVCARDCLVYGVPFRKLDPQYAAWIKHKVNSVQLEDHVLAEVRLAWRAIMAEWERITGTPMPQVRPPDRYVPPRKADILRNIG